MPAHWPIVLAPLLDSTDREIVRRSFPDRQLSDCGPSVAGVPVSLGLVTQLGRPLNPLLAFYG
jgi:hypothetical protein